VVVQKSFLVLKVMRISSRKKRSFTLLAEKGKGGGDSLADRGGKHPHASGRSHLRGKGREGFLRRKRTSLKKNKRGTQGERDDTRFYGGSRLLSNGRRHLFCRKEIKDKRETAFILRRKEEEKNYMQPPEKELFTAKKQAPLLPGIGERGGNCFGGGLP